MKIKRIFDLAINVAQQSTHLYRHGSVLVHHGKIINTACNSVHYSKFAKRFYCKARKDWVSRHAELSVVLNMPKHQTCGGVVYVVRINNNLKMMNSKPCSICMDVCFFVGVKRIVYSIDENSYGVVNLN